MSYNCEKCQELFSIEKLRYEALCPYCNCYPFTASDILETQHKVYVFDRCSGTVQKQERSQQYQCATCSRNHKFDSERVAFIVFRTQIHEQLIDGKKWSHTLKNTDTIKQAENIKTKMKTPASQEANKQTYKVINKANKTFETETAGNEKRTKEMEVELLKLVKLKKDLVTPAFKPSLPNPTTLQETLPFCQLPVTTMEVIKSIEQAPIVSEPAKPRDSFSSERWKEQAAQALIEACRRSLKKSAKPMDSFSSGCSMELGKALSEAYRRSLEKPAPQNLPHSQGLKTNPQEAAESRKVQNKYKEICDKDLKINMGKTCNEIVGNTDPIAKKKLEEKLETLEEERDQLLMTQAVLEKEHNLDLAQRDKKIRSLEREIRENRLSSSVFSEIKKEIRDWCGFEAVAEYVYPVLLRDMKESMEDNLAQLSELQKRLENQTAELQDARQMQVECVEEWNKEKELLRECVGQHQEDFSQHRKENSRLQLELFTIKKELLHIATLFGQPKESPTEILEEIYKRLEAAKTLAGVLPELEDIVEQNEKMNLKAKEELLKQLEESRQEVKNLQLEKDCLIKRIQALEEENIKTEREKEQIMESINKTLDMCKQARQDVFPLSPNIVTSPLATPQKKMETFLDHMESKEKEGKVSKQDQNEIVTSPSQSTSPWFRYVRDFVQPQKKEDQEVVMIEDTTKSTTHQEQIGNLLSKFGKSLLELLTFDEDEEVFVDCK